jgi:hypothetical protein
MPEATVFARVKSVQRENNVGFAEIEPLTHTLSPQQCGARDRVGAEEHRSESQQINRQPHRGEETLARKRLLGLGLQSPGHALRAVGANRAHLGCALRDKGY